MGNRLARTSTVQGVPSQGSTYDANDRIEGNGYDANGNTTSSSVEYTGNAGGTAGNNLDAYDHADRLTTRTNADGSTVQLAYNGDGLLVRKATTLNGVTTTTEYLVDELNPTGYSQVVEEKVNGQLSATYTYGHDLISQDRRDGSGTWSASFYGYDGHGNTRLLINEAGAVTDTYTYEAFGQLIHTQSVTGYSGTANAYLYCGERYVAELGLYHLRARMMNPLSGRFWNMDTWEGDSEDSVTLHKYLYASGEPIGSVDPSGEATIGELAITSSLIAGATTGLVSYVRGDSPAQIMANSLLAAIIAPAAVMGVLGGSAAIATLTGASASFTAGAIFTGLALNAAMMNIFDIMGATNDRERYAACLSLTLDAGSLGFAAFKSLRLPYLPPNARNGVVLPNSKGNAGAIFSEALALFRGEVIIGREILVRASNGVRMRVDLVTKSLFTGRIRIVESKFGPSADFTPNQKLAIPAIARDGTVTIANSRAARDAGFVPGEKLTDLDISVDRYTSY